MAIAKPAARTAEPKPASPPPAPQQVAPQQVAPPQVAPQPPPTPKPPPIAANSDLMQELKVTGHMMALPPGLFCILNETNAATGRSGGMPGVRISPPPLDTASVEIVGFRPDGWLSADGDAALVRVRGPAGKVLVTIYQLSDQPDSAPKLQVRQLLGPGANADAPAAGAAAPAPAGPPERVDVLAHIQSRGDVGVKFGAWLGERGSGNWIEGFAAAAPEGINAADLSYQAVLGRGWLSPWVEAGQYCGSRGMALPLLGLRVRLSGEAAEQYDITCEASFVGGATAGPVGNDQTCEAAELAPLEAMLLTLTPKPRKAARPKR